MAYTPTKTDAEAPTLTAIDRCDRCSAQAYVRVHLVAIKADLLFCGHHARANAQPMDKKDKLVFDRFGHRQAQDYLFDFRLPPEEKTFSDD